MIEKQKLQNLILNIAVDIKKLCDEHGIEYFLNGGTLLGSIRHNGFIPWDDDFDIGMDRKNFNKFVSVCKQALDKEKYSLVTYEDQNYCFLFAKVHLNGTKIIENFSKDVDVHHGIFVDIFPYDNIPDSTLARKIFLLKNKVLKNLIWVKCGYGNQAQKKKISYKLIKLFARPFRITYLKSKRNILTNKYNKLPCKNCFLSDYPSEIIPTKWLEQYSNYCFETVSFKSLSNYDEFLKHVYGDYMELPPENERICHTNCNVDYGEYYKSVDVITYLRN
ncbi:phosphorylcholine transferase LicD [uncultured Ruminococcus sp.]|uniref:LicD family protein n=1 Tax=uncultured Ruminococcus sp. TaxID=165186 RepID=UPI0025EB812A|nr:LicD family protein [uncultured Ruminococcus sp.]